MIPLQTVKIISAPRFEEDCPEDSGFKRNGDLYQRTTQFATEDLRPENISVILSFPVEEAMAKVDTSNRLLEMIKKIYRCRARFLDSFSCSQCKIKKELRLLLAEAYSKNITATIQDVQVNNNSFPWLWCKADAGYPHLTLWQQFWKPYPESYAHNL